MTDERILYEMMEGNIKKKDLDLIDVSNWSEKKYSLFKIIADLIEKEKKVSMENIYHEGGKEHLLAAMAILNKYDAEKYAKT